MGLHILHGNAPAYSSRKVIEYLEEHNFKTLPNPAYLRASTSHLATFASTYVQIRKFYEHKIVIIFLPINLNMCFGCSKEPSH